MQAPGGQQLPGAAYGAMALPGGAQLQLPGGVAAAAALAAAAAAGIPGAVPVVRPPGGAMPSGAPAPPAGAAAAPGAAPGAAGAGAAAGGAPPGSTGKKKRKFGGEKASAPEKVSTLIPESALYNHLLDLDRVVSDVINRRKADFKEPFPPYHDPVKRVLRLVVQGTYANQPPPPKPAPAPVPVPVPGSAGPTAGNAAAMASATAAIFSTPPFDPAAVEQPAEPPCWSIQISGGLVDPTEPLVKAALAAAAAAAARGDPTSVGLLAQAQSLAAQHAKQQQEALANGTAKVNWLTNVVRRIEFVLDPTQYPGEAGHVVWDKAAHTGPAREVVEVRRLGSASSRVTLLITPDYQPERYVLPPLLAETLGMLGHETRSRVIVALYGFIKSRKLQDPQQPNRINLTPELEKVFGSPTLKLNELGTRLASLLSPVPPVRVEYDIKLDGLRPKDASAPSAPLAGALPLEVYDLDFFTPSPLPHQMGAVLSSYYKEKEIEQMDAKLHALIRRLNEARRRRALLLGFASAPIDTTHALLAAQARDVRVARPNAGREFDLERRSEVFRQRWVEDALMNYLHKRMGRPDAAAAASEMAGAEGGQGA
ncbi:hypothetical protein HYH03_006479 [Edaphochlamys debaryana]|uniref:DM2 domain-containing protein n=1 Tax=Edaphochlamys debaryana TaxID=47281 RepID=A0A836C080_9CHLO|nr:hypothetical protein HYH03_006479 [Edaphochlamys debaryana]|eukprot:KAG2495536.1 hypothetical protein HYH03_006479 [Edaphochlamys debaryana]